MLLLGGAVFGGAMVALVSWLNTPEGNATVLKVCHDGTLVLKGEDGEVRVVRPGASHSWRAVSDKVCEP
jgi:hypothetical protein